jgi:hypothetical protein
MFRGQKLHLDHAADGGYLGLAHERCNTRAGGRLGNAVRRSRRPRATPITGPNSEAPPPPDPRLPVW